MMKKVITRMLAFAAVLLCGGAWAATPVAVWTNFTGANNTDGITVDSYTLKANGNEIAQDGSTITINQNVGVKIDRSSALANNVGMTVIYRFRNLVVGGTAKTLATSSTITSGNDRTGVKIDTNGYAGGMWADGDYNDHIIVRDTLSETVESGSVAFVYGPNVSGNTGTYLYVQKGDENFFTPLYASDGLKGSSDTPVGVVIGGRRAANDSFPAATSLIIESVAMFDKALTANEVAEYGAMPKSRAISINFANGTAANAGCIQANELVDSIIGTIPATAWVNVATSAGSDGRKGSASIAHAWNSGAVEDLNDVGVAWTTTSTGLKNIKVDYHAAHKTILNGYYCRADGNYLDNSTVTVSGIPYANYDVIVYLAHQTDTALANQSVSINGSSYYGGPVDAEHPYGTYQGNNPSWGTPGELHSFSYGGNVLRVTNQTSQTATISIPAQHWIGVAAVQIVETPASTPTPGLRVVSMNFNARDSDQWAPTSSRGTVGLTEGVPGCSWNNQYARKSGSFTETLDKPIMWNGAVVSTSDMKIEYGAANNYHNVGRTDVILRGYLDDGGSRANVKISNIPFKKYSVVVYCGTDTGAYFSPVTINGVPYRWGDNGIEVAPSADATTTSRWGTGNTATAQMGVNVLKLEGLYGSAVTIVGGDNNNSARGGIAAVQIVEEEISEIEDEVVWSNLDSTASAATHFTVGSGKSSQMVLNLAATTATPVGTVIGVSSIKISNQVKTMADKMVVNGVEGTKVSAESATFQNTGTTMNTLYVYNFATPINVVVGTDYEISWKDSSGNATTSQVSGINDNSPINITNLSSPYTNHKGFCSVEGTICSFPTLPDTISYTAGDPSEWQSLGIGVAEKDALSFLKEIANRYTFAATFGNTAMDATPRDGTPLNVTLHSDGVLTVEMQVVNGGHKKAALVGFKVDGGLLKVKRIKSAYAPTTFNGPLMTYTNGTASRTTGTTDNGSYILANVTLTRITKFKDDAVEPDFLSTTTPIIRYDASAYDNFTYNENGEVQSWKDMSANNNNATPAAARSDNTDVTRYGRVEVVNGVPAFQMGDAGSCIDLGFTRKTDIRTVFWVMDIKQTQNAFFLGDVDTDQKYHFHRGGDGKYADGTHAPNEYKNGAFTCDGATVANVTSTIVPTGLHVFSVKTTGNVTASRLSQDRDQNDRNGGRAISELVVFNSELTDDQIAAMNKYLLYKWMSLKMGEISATLSEGSQNFSSITWNDGAQFANGNNVTLAVDSTTTLTIDEEVIVGSLTLTGAGALTINNAQNLTFGEIDISGFTGTINYNVDATRAAFTASESLKAFIKDAAHKVVFTFTGSGANGATIDYGGGELSSNPDIGGRLIFSGGTHTLQICHGNVDSGKGSLATGGTIDAPSILATNNATLTYKMKDMCGWNGEFDAGSTVKVDAGSKIKLVHNQSNNSMFMRGRLVIVPGGELEIDPTSEENALAIYGGDSASSDHTNAQIYVPAPAQDAANTVAKITVASGVTRTPIKFRGASAITVEAGATLDISASVKGTEAITKYGDGILRMPNRSDYTGTITVAEGYFDMGATRDFTTLSGVAITGTGAIVIHETAAEYANASLEVVNPNNYTIKVIRPGTTALVDIDTVVADTEIKISGAAADVDVVFNRPTDSGINRGDFIYYTMDYCSMDNVYLRYDRNPPAYVNSSDGIYLNNRPYIYGISHDWFKGTTQLSLAVVGTMPDIDNCPFIHIGAVTGGASDTGNHGIVIATGTVVNDDTVKDVKVYANTGTSKELLSTIKVPYATTKAHSYVVTKNDDTPGKTIISIYLDGVLWETKTIDAMTITGGVQVGSTYGGQVTGLPRINENAAVADCKGCVNVIRIYGREITGDEIYKYSVTYPYQSPSGNYNRTFAADVNQLWKVDAAWTSSLADESDGVAVPVKGITTATFVGNTTVAVNQSELVQYEKLTIAGSGTITFKKGDGSTAIESVATVINTPIVLSEGSISLTGGPTTIGDHGKVTFDFSSLTAQAVVEHPLNEKVTGIIKEDKNIGTDDAKIVVIKPTDTRINLELQYRDQCYYVVATVAPINVYYESGYFNAAESDDHPILKKTDGTVIDYSNVLACDTVVIRGTDNGQIGFSGAVFYASPTIFKNIKVEKSVLLYAGKTATFFEGSAFDIADGVTLELSNYTGGGVNQKMTLSDVEFGGAGTVKIDSTMTAGSLSGTATIEIAADATLTPTSIANKVIGSGTLQFVGDGADGDAVSVPEVTGLTEDTWTGTFEIKNWNGTTNNPRILTPANYGNAKSSLRLNGYKGYVYHGTHAFKAITIGENGVIFNGSYSSGNDIVFKADTITGSGAIDCHVGGGNGTMKFVGNASGFSGSVTANTKYRFAFVATDAATLPDYTQKTIIVGAGETITVGSDNAWTADGGVLVAGTLAGSATVSGPMTLTTESAKATVASVTGAVTTTVDGYSVVYNEVGSAKVYELMQNGGTPPEIVIPQGTTEVSLVPGQEATYEGDAPTSITVKIPSATGTGDAYDVTSYCTVTTANGTITTTLDAEKVRPAEANITMSTPTEGEGESATDKVQFTITNPIPGLFYEIVSGDSFDEHGALVVDEAAEKGTSQATTSAEAKTVSIPMTFTGDKKVKYYKVSVKATK